MNSFTKAIVLVALCFSAVSAQVTVDCETLYNSWITVLTLEGDTFQISSINLSSYWVSTLINNACINVGAFGNNFKYLCSFSYILDYFFSPT